MADFYNGFQDMEIEIEKLTAVFDELSRKAKDSICEEAVTSAAPIILNEEKRLLLANPKYAGFAKLLSSKVYKNRKGQYAASCGYSSEAISSNIKIAIIEFGRPGSSKKALKKGGKDTKGRRCVLTIRILDRQSERIAKFTRKNTNKGLVTAKRWQVLCFLCYSASVLFAICSINEIFLGTRTALC